MIRNVGVTLARTLGERKWLLDTRSQQRWQRLPMNHLRDIKLTRESASTLLWSKLLPRIMKSERGVSWSSTSSGSSQTALNNFVAKREREAGFNFFMKVNEEADLRMMFLHNLVENFFLEKISTCCTMRSRTDGRRPNRTVLNFLNMFHCLCL